jgi:hypothetical protein
MHSKSLDSLSREKQYKRLCAWERTRETVSKKAAFRNGPRAKRRHLGTGGGSRIVLVRPPGLIADSCFAQLAGARVQPNTRRILCLAASRRRRGQETDDPKVDMSFCDSSEVDDAGTLLVNAERG